MRRKRRAARGSPAWTRRGVLALVLLAVVFVPVPGAASGQQAPACLGCRAQSVNAERWASPLPGQWAAVDSATGTVPASGQDYVAVGGEVAAIGGGLTVTAYDLRDGKLLWQATLLAPAGSAIMSVRAWPGVVTAGVIGASGRTRTEFVLDAATGQEFGSHPAAVFGGAVEASAAATVIIGPDSVTSYDNTDGKVLWGRPIGTAQAWRADGGTLYVAESAQGYLGSAPVTGLRVIDLNSGTERTLLSPPGHPFSGTMSIAADGAVLFTSAAGVTAYSGSTGGALWSMPSAVPEGADPSADLLYLTSAGGALVGVDPLTGAVRASVTGSTAGGAAGMYVVRGGVALGLDSGQGGDAWGYDLAAGRVDLDGSRPALAALFRRPLRSWRQRRAVHQRGGDRGMRAHGARRAQRLPDRHRPDRHCLRAAHGYARGHRHTHPARRLCHHHQERGQRPDRDAESVPDPDVHPVADGAGAPVRRPRTRRAQRLTRPSPAKRARSG